MDRGVNQFAAKMRKDSGWWGDQTFNFSNKLSKDDLRETLRRKSLCPDLDSPGVYIYVNKSSGKMYIGKAVSQTILERQQQHLYSASHGGQVGKFDAALLCGFNVANWDFYAIPMEESTDKEIADKERELVLKHGSICYGYNTQLPGGR